MKPIALITITFFLLAGCSRNQSGEFFSTNADTISTSGLTGNALKQVKTADMDFKVKDVYKAASDISTEARSIGGVVSKRKIESVTEQNKKLKISDDSVQVISSYIIKAAMIVRIPSEKLDSFLDSVSQAASFIQSQTLDINDKSLEYASLEAKKEQREKAAAAIESSGNPSRLIREKETGINQELASKQIDAEVKLSTVQLNFSQNPIVRSEIQADYNLSDYRLPFIRSMKNAFFNGWNYFLSFIIGIAHLWMFILAGAAIIFTAKYYSRKRKLNYEVKE